MTEYKKVGSKTIAGKKAPVSVYKKNGSNKLYVKRNGLMISYVSYKKSFAKKLLGKTLNKVKKPNQKTRRRYTMGGDCANMKGGMYELFGETPAGTPPPIKNEQRNDIIGSTAEFINKNIVETSGLDYVAHTMGNLANPYIKTVTDNSNNAKGGHMKKYKKKYQRFGGNVGYSDSEPNDFSRLDGGKRHKRIVKKNLKKRVVKK